jgi:L-threonylcarbamoyladenylate synthase
MPDHRVALVLIGLAGVPIAAPSANTFGYISPTTAEHVLDDLDGRIDAVLDAGPTSHGVESTVVDPSKGPILIYRPGAVTAAQILGVAGAVEVFQASPIQAPPTALPSPGVGIRHYAPAARLVLVEAAAADLPAKLAEEARQWPGESLGVLLPADLHVSIPGAVLQPWGRWSAPEELARELYAGLRALDARGCAVILCPVPSASGIGAAIRDRLFKAAQT